MDAMVPVCPALIVIPLSMVTTALTCTTLTIADVLTVSRHLGLSKVTLLMKDSTLQVESSCVTVGSVTTTTLPLEKPTVPSGEVVCGWASGWRLWTSVATSTTSGDLLTTWLELSLERMGRQLIAALLLSSSHWPG